MVRLAVRLSASASISANNWKESGWRVFAQAINDCVANLQSG
ncbi:hypothetical protein C7S13_8189 [Burkholderia cepacia]|nr:hypothetical protein [Burkholderia cepacia]